MSTYLTTKERSERIKKEKRERREQSIMVKEADIWFKFDLDDGTTTRFPAKKSLLANVSDVFQAKFNGEWKGINEVVVTDAAAGEFKEFLRFFYGFDMELTTENVAVVMNLGLKYSVENCVDDCFNYLKKNLTDENVCTTLWLAIQHERTTLMVICEKHIQANTTAVIASAGFLECNKEVLAYMLKTSPLSCFEFYLFEACMAWVRAKSKQNTVTKATVQKYLSDLYYDIRYASMTMEEFCVLEETYSEVFSEDDLYDITGLIVQREEKPKRFNTTMRRIEHPAPFNWNENKIETFCRISESTAERRYVLNAEEKTVFSTSKPLLLGSLTCSQIFNVNKKFSANSDLSIQIEITEALTLDGASVKVLSNTAITSRRMCPLPEPILVRPSFFYTICIKGYSEKNYIYSQRLKNFLSLQRRIGNQLVNIIELKFYNDKLVDASAVGLITDLHFYKISM